MNVQVGDLLSQNPRAFPIFVEQAIPSIAFVETAIPSIAFVETAIPSIDFVEQAIPFIANNRPV
jgi:hypothetical protein